MKLTTGKRLEITCSSISIIIGSTMIFILLSLISLTTMILLGFLSEIMFSHIIEPLYYSIIPTAITLGYFGYKVSQELKLEHDNIQIAKTYSTLINFTYWASFIGIIMVTTELGVISIITATLGFSLGLYLWPYTIGFVIVKSSNVAFRMLKKIQ